MNSKLLWTEVNDMQKRLPQLILAWRVANAAAKQSALALNAKKVAAFNMREIIDLGDKLARELVANCAGICQLVDMQRHHYRPTLRADAGVAYILLADAYDVVAEARGYSQRAYRG